MSDDRIPYTRLTPGELNRLPGAGLAAPESGRGRWLIAAAVGLCASVCSLLVVQIATGGARLSYWGMRAAFHGFRSPPVRVLGEAAHHGSSGGHGKGAALAVIVLVAVALVIFAVEVVGTKLAVCLAIGLATSLVLARRMDAPLPQLPGSQRQPIRRRRR